MMRRGNPRLSQSENVRSSATSADETPQAPTPAGTPRMQEGPNVLQRVTGSSSDIRPSACLAECCDNSVFVELTVDPGQVPEARGGERLYLMVIVIEQSQVELL
jgi:hypothetical protein